MAERDHVADTPPADMPPNTPLPRISVIIPAYNAAHTIDQCLTALEHQTIPREHYEIIVVDDGSTDETRDRVCARPGVRLLTQAHAGPAAARNLGVAHARGPIVLFTDADCVPAENWIAHLTAPFHAPAIAGAKGAYLTDQRALVARFVQLEYEDKYDRMARERQIDFIDTYAAAYRRDIFLANGGFDTAFPTASVEDQEFSFRLARQGQRLVFVPEARVRHLGHADTLGAYWRKKFKIGYWKVLVHRLHPDKLVRDSHTPQILKAQIILVGLAGLFLVGGLLWLPSFLVGGAMVLLFLLSTLPFAIKAWTKDPAVALLSPGLLFVRALALGIGFACGLAMALWRSPTEGNR